MDIRRTDPSDQVILPLLIKLRAGLLSKRITEVVCLSCMSFAMNNVS